MNGPLAQAVALTCHANAALRGRKVTFSPGNSTARFCQRIGFVEMAGGRERQAAASPEEWFALLERENAGAVRLSWSSAGQHDRQLAGLVGGGGSWLLGSATSTWAGRWNVRDRERADRRIWSVDYLRFPRRLQPARAELEKVGDRLIAALKAIRAFAQANAEDWLPPFDRALRTLRTGEPAGYHRDLAPEGTLPPLAATLLDGAQSAWVFGAMGSWNDLGFAGPAGAEYERVSGALFEALTAAISAGASASAN